MRKLFTLALILALCLPMTGRGETLTFQSELLKLHVDLPENWVQVEDPAKYAFVDPDGNGAILIAPSDIPVTPELAESMTPEFVQAWILDESDGGFTDVQQLMFAKTVDEDGNLYAISSCGCTVEGTPLIYTHYFFSAADGTLVSVSGVSINNDAGAVARNWFDQMFLDAVTEDVLYELMAQIQ